MFSTDSNGVSSVIAVALLVAIVVALTALVSVSVFLIQDNSSDESAEATVDMTATQTGVEVTVVRNENAEEFVVQSPSGATDVIQEVGDSTSLDDGVGVYSVIAKLPDGSEQVLDTRRISQSDIGGLFTVNQDTQNKEADATVERDYASTDQYEVIVRSSGSESGSSTVAFTPDPDSGRLLTNPAEEEGMVLQSQGIGIGTKVDLSVPELLQVAPVSPQPDGSEFPIGKPIQLDKMMNLCEGDEVYLVDKNTEEVIAGGDEIEFSMDSCDSLRRVAQYRGNEIVGVELINLWNQDLDYAVFQFNGDVPPPTRPTPEGDDLTVEIEVLNDNTGDPIQGASVAMGEKTTKNTGANGKATFTMGQDDLTLFATARADGFFASQVPVNLVEDDGDNDGVISKTIRLPPEQQQSFQPASGGNAISSIPSGESRTITTSGSAGIAVSGGTGAGFGGGGGGTVSGSGSIYSGSSISSTSTLSAASTPDTTVSRENNDPLVDIVQPKRQFNTLNVDQDLIPTGTDGEFIVRTSVRALEDSDSEVQDEVIIKAISKKDGSEVNLEGVDGDTQEKTVFLTPGETEVVEQRLYFPEGTPAEQYSILVTLDSVAEVQSAGTLEVFQGSLTDATISGADVSPQKPTIERGGSEEMTVTVEDSDISASSGSLTIDLFENGRRIGTKTFDLDSQNQIQFTRTVDELEYYEYHVGIQESQSVALADSVLVSPVLTNTDINLDASLSVQPQGDADCLSETTVGSQFDCEILKGETINLDGNVEATGSDLNELNDVEVIWTWKEASQGGQERAYFEQGREDNGETVIDWTTDLSSQGYSISDFNQATADEGQFDSFNTNSVDLSKQGITYDRSETYIVELRIRGEDADGNQVGAQADRTVNVALDPDETATQITSTGTVNEDTGRLVIESNRGSTPTDVELEFVDESGNVQRSKEVTVPRKGGELELLESFTLSDYQDPNAGVGDDVNVGVRMKELDSDGNVKGVADEATVTFEVVPEIVVDANIRPIACEKSSDADTILTTLDQISDFSQFDEFDSKQDAQDVFATDLSNVNIIDPDYWDSTNNQLDVNAIETDTSCVVAE